LCGLEALTGAAEKHATELKVKVFWDLSQDSEGRDGHGIIATVSVISRMRDLCDECAVTTP
jgi:hypothetical protein